MTFGSSIIQKCRPGTVATEGASPQVADLLMDDSLLQRLLEA